jgi:ABC-type spermidine/putrescine transport system permease subunit I
MSTQAKFSYSLAEGTDVPPARVPAWAWLAAPYVLVLLVFVALPLGNLLFLSFFKHSTTAIFTGEPTFSNYLRLADSFYLALLGRSLWIGAITTLACIAMGYPLAYFLARSSPNVFTLGLFLLVLPLMVSTVIRAFGWIVLLGRQGTINQLLQAMGLEKVSLLYTETAVVLALIQYVLPLMVLPLMAAIEKIPLRLEEAAVNLGASPAAVFFRLIVPMSVPGLISGMLLTFTVAVSVVVTPALLGGRKVRMFGNEIYDQVVTALNWPFAASLSMMMIALTLVAIALGLAISSRLRRRRLEA